MEKLTAYRIPVREAEEMLRDALDDSGIRLSYLIDGVFEASYYFAASENQSLDGAQLDDRFAEILGKRKVENHRADNDDVLVVVLEE